MSLRQKGIEILFADFIKKNFSYFGFQDNPKLTPEILVDTLQQNRLYEKTITLIEHLQQSWSEKSKFEEESHLVCDSIRRYFHLSKFLLFSINQKKRKVEMVYSYPKRAAKEMPINLPFVKMSSDERHQIKCAEAIKNYFQIDFPNMNFDILTHVPLRGGGKIDIPVQFLFYLPDKSFVNPGQPDTDKGFQEGEISTVYSRLFKFIFDFSQNVIDLKVEKGMAPQGLERKTLFTKSSSQKDSLGKVNKIQISAKRVATYQRVISQLPVLIGDGKEEMNQAVKFLLQVAQFSEAVLCDKGLTKVDGIYSLKQPQHNKIHGKMPEDLKRRFLNSEKNHLARKFKLPSEKYLLIFLPQAIHPQKQTPEFPFSGYPNILMKVLTKLSTFSKQK